ncbi:FAD-dependent oxidoreductase [Nakamurella sp.]|uniref:glycerol-3-phosphate dehydrogenase/oxidase n=1 Tax=Nakamurella sp. TaxID=1869182 RepID=UPI003B3A7B56
MPDRAPQPATVPTGSMDPESADPSRLNRAQRARSLRAASGGEHDVLVIGAGVTGAGCAMDAATRGLSVVLVEAGDIAVGTSSRSGKIFHGGLRYLEQYNFGLVAHAIVERDLQVKTLCPHLTRPEPFLYPLSAHWERPYAGAGILLYDIFGLRGRGVPRHRHLTRGGVVRHAPSMDPDVVTGGIQYYDVRMDDARHTLAVVRTAAALGAEVITGAPVVEILKDGDRVTGAVVTDGPDGARHEIRARMVINAAGAWAADVQQLAGAHTFDVQPSKGVHLLLRRDAIDADTGILARASDSVIIARRWWNYWLVGTTDTPWDGDRGSPRPEVADVEYLLRELNHFLRRKVQPADVLGVYAGVRPLLRPVGPDTNTDADATSELSRDHSVIAGPDGLVTIVGGKYTTYRLMAQDTMDAAVATGRLGDVPASLTRSTPLLGAAGWTAIGNRAGALAQEHGLSREQVERLLSRYGNQIHAVLAAGAADRSLIAPRADWAGYLPAELLYAVTAEGARTLTDVLMRRTHLAIELPDGGHEAAPAVAALLADVAGWDAAETDRQVAGYRAAVAADRAALVAVQAGAPASAGAAEPARAGG